MTPPTTRLWATLFLLAVGSSAKATTGADLQPSCMGDRRMVEVYTAGLADAYTDPAITQRLNFCIMDATQSQLADALCAILEERPGDRALPASALAHRSFANRFPCKGRKER